MFGRALTSVLWGTLADRYGRKPVIVFGMISVVIFNTLFGLSTSFWMAVSMRFLLGSLCGILGPMRAYATEVCRKEHQALGLSVISTSWGIGLVIGPAIGGYFAQELYREAGFLWVVKSEDMDTARTVLKIDKNNPGSEVAAETAAALAAASLVFRKTDRAYSRLLVSRAKRVFAFADKYRGAYSNGLKSYVCPFYCDYSGFQDDLLWGSAWLHKATRDPRYLSYIQVNGQTLGASEGDTTFGWDNKHVGARILLTKAFLVGKVQSLHDYKGHADNFICSLIPQNQYTPGGRSRCRP